MSETLTFDPDPPLDKWARCLSCSEEQKQSHSCCVGKQIWQVIIKSALRLIRAILIVLPPCWTRLGAVFTHWFLSYCDWQIQETQNPQKSKQTNHRLNCSEQRESRCEYIHIWLYDLGPIFSIPAFWRCSLVFLFGSVSLKKKKKKILLRERARQRHVPLWQLCRLQTSLMYLTGANQHLMWRRFHSDVTKRVIQQTSAVYSPCQTHAFSLRFDTESVCQLIPGFLNRWFIFTLLYKCNWWAVFENTVGVLMPEIFLIDVS